jgi:hypothetical protein
MTSVPSNFVCVQLGSTNDEYLGCDNVSAIGNVVQPVIFVMPSCVPSLRPSTRRGGSAKLISPSMTTTTCEPMHVLLYARHLELG